MVRTFKPPWGMKIEYVGMNEDKTAVVYTLRFLWWHPAMWWLVVRTVLSMRPTCEVKQCP